MITLRLDPNLEEAVNTAARNLGLTKSDLIRKSIHDYLDKLDNQNAWEVGQDLFGRYASGNENLAKDRKTFLKNKIRAKKG